MNVPDSYIMGFFVSAAVTAVSLPVLTRVCEKLGLVDEPGPRKIHHRPMPLAGGVSIYFGFIVSLLLAFALGTLQFTTALTGKSRFELGVFILAATVILALGLLDDYAELAPLRKFLGQVIVGLLIAIAGIRVTIFIPNAVISYLITVLWIAAVINAFNFTDNMNGLCAGLGCIATFYFGAAAHCAGQTEVAFIAFAICGAIAGFLPYNFPRARAFLGDSGSHLIGFFVAVLAVMPVFFRTSDAKPIAVLKPIGVLAVPLADLLSVVIIRLRARKPFYMGDTNHFSHRLVRKGLSPVAAVVFLWLTSAICGLVVFF